MTNIEWVKNPDGTQGITVNSKTGCLNHTPEGLCLGGLFPCYAYKLANRRLKQRYLANKDFACLSEVTGFAYAGKRGDDPFYPRWWPERLEQIRKLKKPTGIFLDDMSDWMGDYWPEEWTRQELQVMRDCPQHRFYTLTKQAQNLIKFSPFPENYWVGVTATNRRMFCEAIRDLNEVKATVKYISIEPCLERMISNNGWIYEGAENVPIDDAFMLRLAGISWLITGACTGTKKDMEELCKRYPNLALIHYKGNIWTAQPRIEDLQEIVEAADKAGVKVFLKDNLLPLLNSSPSFPWAWNVGHTGALRQEQP